SLLAWEGGSWTACCPGPGSTAGFAEAAVAGVPSSARKGGAKPVLSSSLAAGAPRPASAVVWGGGGGGAASRRGRCGNSAAWDEILRHEKHPPDSASQRLTWSLVQTAPLQSGPAVVEQAQFDQFLYALFGRRVFEQVGHFVQKEVGKLLPGPVQDL